MLAVRVHVGTNCRNAFKCERKNRPHKSWTQRVKNVTFKKFLPYLPSSSSSFLYFFFFHIRFYLFFHSSRTFLIIYILPPAFLPLLKVTLSMGSGGIVPLILNLGARRGERSVSGSRRFIFWGLASWYPNGESKTIPRLCSPERRHYSD